MKLLALCLLLIALTIRTAMKPKPRADSYGTTESSSGSSPDYNQP